MDKKPDLVYTMQKAGVSLPRDTSRPFFVLCPFHDDRKSPNMRVDPNQGLFYCFACNVGGDAITFVGLQMFGQIFNPRDKEMFKQVVERLEKFDVPKVEYKPPKRPKQLTQEIVQALTMAARIYHYALTTHPEGKKARDELIRRKIDVAAMRTYRLGYAAEGALVGTLSTYPESLRKAAEEAGLFIKRKDGRMRELLSRRIIFPDVMKNKSVHHMTGRSLDPNTKAAYKYFALSGMPKTIWGLGRAKRSVPVILVESVPDAVNLLQMGFQGAAVGGTGIASYLLANLKRYDVVILPQNDERGREATTFWSELLPKSRVMWEYPYKQGEKDVNDQVCKYGFSKTKEIIIKALEEVKVTIEVK